ncbi:hypothetical protein IHE45_08G067800 [Dioscorea alata]|uniref:Uncharacterized protein n=1 Tax=Dioscorea alata TaxID=55571 RepID=A0ACB7VJB2_DIOAL|nr:hypothetical protein IHE45_08G067800 [Dioscorea alata]
MKLEGEPLGVQTSHTQNLPLNIIGHHSNPFLNDLPVRDNMSIPEGKHGLTLPVEGKNFEERVSSEGIEPINMSTILNDVGQSGYADNENSEKKAFQIEDEHLEAPYTVPAAEVDIDFCTDKVVSTSETDVCKDGTCYPVKDICVDEGLHSLEKIPTQNKGMSKNITFDCKHPATTNDYVVAIEIRNSKYDLKSSPAAGHCISVFDKDATEELFSGNLSEARDRPNSVDHTDVVFAPKQVKLSGFDRINSLKQSPDQGKIIQDEKGNISAVVVPSADKKLIQSNGSKENTAKNEVASGVITFNFDSAVAPASDTEDNKDNKASHQPTRALYSHLIEDTSSDTATASGRSLLVHHNREDSGFSGPNFMSDPVVSSGHVQFSGSISHRSDSSATSARSFAFPILQPEWNSSPVKMAKADRRHLRKHRCCGIGFSCCRF